MCGIAAASQVPMVGVPADELVLNMIRRMAHRGPDGHGAVGDAGCAVAMCRLRVRSRHADAVPFRRDGDAFAFNGEVYHVRSPDGRAGAPAGGLAEAVSVGEHADEHLDGMYALAHRAGDGTLRLVRDPLGIKPLYLRRDAQGIAAASELPALVTAYGRAAIRPAAIAQYLMLGRVVDGGTFFAGIDPLLPGERLTVRDGRVVARAFGRASDEVAPDLPIAVKTAMDRVLLADRSLGLAVSGGLDSTILAAELSRAGVCDLATVSVVPEGSGDGVRALAELGLPEGAWRTWRHHHVTFGPRDLLAGIPAAVASLGEPTSLTSVPMYAALAALARRSGITVLIVGEGADELFGGYRSYLSLPAMSSAADFYAPAADDTADLLAPALRAEVRQLADELWGGPAGGVREHELTHSLEPLLRRTDHLLMAQGIEGRTPFLHAGLPALAAALPFDELVTGGQTKVALRRAYADELPHFQDEVKRPFRAPLGAWLVGAVAEQVAAGLLADIDLLAGVGVRPPGVRRLAGQIRRGEAEAAAMAFRLLTLGAWLRWYQTC